MTQAIFGFFGSLVGLVVTAIAASAGITFFIVLWKSGSLPATMDTIGSIITGSFGAVKEFFAFLRDLIVFAGS